MPQAITHVNNLFQYVNCRVPLHCAVSPFPALPFLLGACDVAEKFSDYDFEGTSSNLISGQNQSWVGASWNDGGIRSFSMLDG